MKPGGTTLNERFYALIRRVPVVGPIFRITNAYAFQGAAGCHSRMAPLSSWWDRILKKVLYIVLLVEVIIVCHGGDISAIPWRADETILSVFPSILGFGIGVFALLFIMPESFLVFMSTNREKLTFGPEIVPVDIAYPLIVFTLALGWAALNKFSENAFTNVTSMFLFFYGLAMTFELISFLLNSSLLIQKISLKEYERRDRKKKVQLSKTRLKNRMNNR
ncbi:TPA: hypothetical protein SMF26_004469 [Serratia marcescens]|nr:hypothetical protein [Serratia marcescens]